LELEGKSIVVTGGAGFIGTKLCNILAHKNKIFIYDNLHQSSIKTTGLLDNNNVYLMQGDILDFPKLQQFINETDGNA